MKKLEVLAPAGSKDSFIAAVEAGADALYCGLGSFSARAKAENFTPAEFNNYVNYAHSKNVKVYAAFNTLIKQSEIKEAVKHLGFISAAKADGVIVQDFGIANIAQRHFPDLNLHASTQMTIHNGYGALEAQKAGFKRAVLARELSLREISTIAKKSDIELEIFVHGALCFCVSGICLMSSFIGGHSGNRGSCAQPCRRKWNVAKKEGFYLSPKDLELAPYMRDLKKAGVTSLKIEGRMKNPQYVYKTVKAYKMLASADDNNFNDVLIEASNTLEQDFARPKTSFNFACKSADIFTPDMPKQLGINLGKILAAENGVITLTTNFEISKSDTLKAADAAKDAYFKMDIVNIEKSGSTYIIETGNSFLKIGMDIFKTASADFGSVIDNIISKTKIEKLKFEPAGTEIKDPLFKTFDPKEELFIRIDNIAWLKELPHDSSVILMLGRENLKQSADFKKISYFELPPYIDEIDISAFQQAVNRLSQNPKAGFFVNNPAHFHFFKKEALLPKLFAGQFLYCMNAFAADFLFKKGVKGFSFSWEDDLKNIAELSKCGLGANGIFYLSGLPVLAVSKMASHKDITSDAMLVSAKDSFRIIRKADTSFVLPQYPVMLFNKKQQLKKLKINKFAIDLSFMLPNKNYINALLDAYKGVRPLQNDFEFNFERGLK